MEFERREFVALSVDEARRRTAEYLISLGYKPSSTGSPLLFVRGSVLGSLVSFTPRGWQSRATVDIRPAEGGVHVSARLDVSAGGQMVTGKEKAFLARELDGLVSVLGGNNPTAGAYAHSDRELIKQNSVAVGLIFVVGVVANVIVYVLTRQLIIAVSVGVIASLIVAGILMLAARRSS